MTGEVWHRGVAVQAGARRAPTGLQRRWAATVVMLFWCRKANRSVEVGVEGCATVLTGDRAMPGGSRQVRMKALRYAQRVSRAAGTCRTASNRCKGTGAGSVWRPVAAGGGAVIRLENVTKRYPNGHVAVDQVTITIHRGEFVFLVGPSGAGKSTLVRLLYHDEVATTGGVYVDQFRLRRLRRRQVPHLRRQLGVVFQDVKLLNERTVYQNVQFALEVVGASTHEMRQRVPELLDLVGLANRHRHLPGQLSGGEQQRVGIARALANRPKYLIADEPTGNLDPETARGIVQLLAEINRRGATVIIATHAKDIVNQMQRRVVALEGGRIVRDEARGLYGYEA